MSKNVFDLDPERLGTTDEHGDRVYLFPEEVKGKWKTRRKIFFWFLIGLYLVLPWFNINGKPALQIDIFNREFTFLGGTLHGIEPVLFFLILSSGLFFIAFLTSTLGRVWCGWACPQTVFIQGIFWKIESWVEGSARQRRREENEPWTWNRRWRRVAKWFLFFLVSAHIAHTFIGYFVGPRVLLAITSASPSEHWGLFISTCILTLIFLLDFGWFREQFCIIACPYGRIQSVMLDEHSLVVAYDKERNHDCINCYNCVKVCPTGIDIRRGLQLECIHCTQCIDACDTIMDKLHRPRGLIRYASENSKITPRSILYAVIGVVLAGLFFVFLNSSLNVKMLFIRSRVPFTRTHEGLILNSFQLKLIHQGNTSPVISFRLKDHSLNQQVRIITPAHPIKLDEAEIKSVAVFEFKQSTKVIVEAVDTVTGDVVSEREVSLVGPVQ